MKKTSYIFKIVLTCSVFALLCTGCLFRDNSDNPSKSPAPSTPINAEASPKPGDNVELEIKQDNKLTEALKKEKEILDGRIYSQNGSVFGTMIIKAEIKQNDIDELVNKYGNEIKKAYKECEINIQAVQNGKNVANKTF